MQARSGRRRFAVLGAVLAVSTLLLSACSADSTVTVDVPEQVDAQLPDETASEIQSAVEFAMAATGSTGAIVGVWAPWSGELVSGFGTADSGDASELTFRGADVTRAMTCDALYQLVDDGVVALDDPVSTYVSSVAGLGSTTLEELCNGTSGLGSYWPVIESMSLSTPERNWEPRELVAYGMGRATDAVPGTVWDDSDAGYVLLGLALESATQKTAAALFDDVIFEPLEMDSTSLPSGTATTPGANALDGTLSLPGEDGALNCAEPDDVTEYSSSIGFTNSGVVTSITDLGHYTQALAVDALGVDGSDRFSTPLPVDSSGPTWFTSTGGAYQAGSLIGQFGKVPGYITASFADPTTGMTVSVVLNNSAADANVGAYLAWQIAAITSKAPAASGQTAPDAGLPWTAEQYHDAIAQAAVCPLPE
ncbi:D-alanyl-D-alanine carboxypeptidase [Microbacterium endophyticum]|uniref:D-alanyl-D-alanine carboxypeptidase n=1 Tax=Microbacterium endophyticum TaxID=1526412 RepID=A0A7W4V4M8_9MICO|nr:serine hydrolase domain-containing protein [Microbacterium endophyticum]MBB2976444.1 D-alanyl-D-alanine carboxypeptidase [Microbacterium endophyticum]NIK35890.1 D-alanyl-D-alanine carboxypeptidase [Microbacterium endophyticum]